jgi:hypothetical protein
MHDFKVGDRVKATANSAYVIHGGGEIVEGTLGRVVEVDEVDAFLWPLRVKYDTHYKPLRTGADEVVHADGE